jgi:hypothetical protein
MVGTELLSEALKSFPFGLFLVIEEEVVETVYMLATYHCQSLSCEKRTQTRDGLDARTRHVVPNLSVI